MTETPPRRILVVEDERPIREGLRDHLRRAGFEVATAESIREAAEHLAGAELLVLDRRLPDGDGLEILRDLRGRGVQTPVIVLSALGETDQRIDGFAHGADDYVTKPFDLHELEARVRAVLHRSPSNSATSSQSNANGDGDRGELAFGACVLDVGARTIRRGKERIELSRMEFNLLLYLRRNAGRAIPRNELLDRVWGYDRFPTTRTVDFHVLALRKKVEQKPESPQHIITVHRVGYRFDL